MTGIDIREALHEVASTTPAPSRDDLAFRRLVRQEQRRRLASRAGLVLGVAAAAAIVVATTVVPFVQGDGAQEQPPATRPSDPPAVDLAIPVALVADGRLTVLDPQGGVHDLGLRTEEVLGSTSEFIYAIDDQSKVVRYDVSSSPWEFERVDSGVDVPVQSAALSPDGIRLGWIDRDGSLTVSNLKDDDSTAPFIQPPNSYLTNLAQGTGNPLVSQDGDLKLLSDSRAPVAIPTARDGYGVVAQATRDLVAVMDRDDRTRIYDVSSGTARLVDTVAGGGVLAPYGDHLVSVDLARDDSSSVLLWTAGGDTVPLPVPGQPQTVAWADDDTALVTTYDGEGTALYGCEVGSTECARLALDGVEDVTLAR